jgi:hypothetical protein
MSATDPRPAGSRVALWGAVIVMSPVAGAAAVSLAVRLGHEHVLGTDTSSLPWAALPLLAAWGWWLHRFARMQDSTPGIAVLAAVVGMVWAGVAGLLAAAG